MLFSQLSEYHNRKRDNAMILENHIQYCALEIIAGHWPSHSAHVICVWLSVSAKKSAGTMTINFTMSVIVVVAIVNRDMGPVSIWICRLSSIGNPIVEIRRPKDRLISTMGIPLLVWRHTFTESPPDYSSGVPIKESVLLAYFIYFRVIFNKGNILFASIAQA